MDKNGKSDPFVRFLCTDLFGKEQPKTKVCKKTLNPAWENKAVPTLRATVDGGIDVVRAMHLFLVLWGVTPWGWMHRASIALRGKTHLVCYYR